MQIWYCDTCKLLFHGSLTVCPRCGNAPKLELRRGEEHYLGQGYAYYSGEVQAPGNHHDGNGFQRAQGVIAANSAGPRAQQPNLPQYAASVPPVADRPRNGAPTPPDANPGVRQSFIPADRPRSTAPTPPDANPGVRQPSMPADRPRNDAPTPPDANPADRPRNDAPVPPDANPGVRQPSSPASTVTTQAPPVNRTTGRRSPPAPGRSAPARIATDRTTLSSPAESAPRNESFDVSVDPAYRNPSRSGRRSGSLRFEPSNINWRVVITVLLALLAIGMAAFLVYVIWTYREMILYALIVIGILIAIGLYLRWRFRFRRW